MKRAAEDVRAPRLARWLLGKVLPADVREDVIGDLAEVYRDRAVERGRAAAARWYLWQTLSFALHFGWERVRGRAQTRWPGVSLLDFKLGVRMLVRYPGLTLVGGVAMAFAIWVGAGAFEVVMQAVRPKLPLPDGDRIVGIQNWDAASSRVNGRVLHDLAVWRSELQTVRDVGAFRAIERTLIAGDGHGEPVEIAEIQASAFRVARVPPLLGRVLVEADEQPGAPAVAVIGYDLWRTRFGGDSAVIGRTIGVGRSLATVVGVMPEGFGFPVAQRMWMPLRVQPLQHARGEGPTLRVFGVLVEGATLARAQAELDALGARTAAEFPETHEHLRPRVLPYAASITGITGGLSMMLMSVNVFLVLLVVLVCGNIALLMFARAATRESEIVVRSALGASRGRIVTQLCAEALVLGTIAAVVGIAAARAGIAWGMRVLEAESRTSLPFWFSDSLSTTTILYVVLLTLLGAAIAGAIPALKMTRPLQAQLRESGSGSLSFGGIWTVVIISQVAVTVAFPVSSWMLRRDLVALRTVDTGYETAEYLTARLEMDADALDSGAFGRVYEELHRRLLREPGVTGVTFADRLPRMYHPHRLVEVDAGGAAPLHPAWPAYRVSSAAIDPAYLEVVDVPVLAGRGFVPGDADSTRRVVIVNQSFVNRVLGGRNAVGRRVRYVHYEEWNAARSAADPPPPWYEIVGVVRDMGMSWGSDPKAAGIYHAATPQAAHPLNIAIRVQGAEPDALSNRLRAIAAAIDPALRVRDPQPLAAVNHGEVAFLQFWFRLTLVVSGVALLLSLAGIYAVMSFTVARRTREIGIRIALGANPRRLLLGVLRRPLLQVTAGLIAGAALASLLLLAAFRDSISGTAVALFAAYAAAMLCICLLACVGPTRRALRIQPTDALRAEV